MTCVRTQGFLAQHRIDTAELVPASRKLGLKDGLALLEGARALVACKGKRVERFDLKAGLPDRATLERVLLGPTGNLRAPTLRVGRIVIVGYDEATYRELLESGAKPNLD